MIAAFSFALLPTSARADDAQSLLAKHKAFVGWTYGDGSVRSLMLERKLTDDKNAMTQTATEYRLGIAYRRDYHNAKGGGGSTGFTGNIFWTTSGNGFTVPMVGDEAKYFLSIDALFMEGTPQLPATLKGPAAVNGKNVQIVSVTMGGALPMDLYVDPDTGAYVRAVIDPGGTNESTINIRSYANIDSTKKMIGAWTFDKSSSVYSYTKLTLNPNLAASTLHPPASSATWAFTNPHAFPIKVTDSRIYVDATVNGVPGRFILDTGASGIALFDHFTKRTNLKEITESKSFGIGGETKSKIYKADTVVIGGNTLSNAYVSSLDENFHDRDETPDGLMGFDVFGGAVVYVTISNSTMTIKDPTTTTVDPSIGYRVTPSLATLTPTIPVSIGGKLSVNVTLDTGANYLVLLSKELQSHGISLVANRENTFLGGNAAIGGVGGTEMVICGRIPPLSIGPIIYGDLNACESDNWGLHEGLVGFDFIKHFDLVFDYPHGQMFMAPIKE